MRESSVSRSPNALAPPIVSTHLSKSGRNRSTLYVPPIKLYIYSHYIAIETNDYLPKQIVLIIYYNTNRQLRRSVLECQ